MYICVCVCVFVCVGVYIYIYIYVCMYVCYMCMFSASCFRQRTYVAQGLINGVLTET